MPFRPEEVLFSSTTSCNLACPHCVIKRSKTVLSIKAAEKFLIDCKENGINRVGFTGGEPFLAREFLYSITKFAVEKRFLFTRVMTNGVWYKDSRDLEQTLKRLFEAGYDGSICISVDAYHAQDAGKLARFIEIAHAIWRRPDIISVVYATGSDNVTKQKLSRLARLLKGRLSGFGGSHPSIRSGELFIKIGRIELSPIGKAERLRDPWDGRWFKEDYCKGPGNVFFVEPSGTVKPCCGYASGSSSLSIGNIKKDTVAAMIKNIRQNPVVCAIFNSGLKHIRDRLIKRGMKFPGKTGNSCFFCHYILTKVPRMKKIFLFCLAAVFIFYSAPAFAQYTNDQQNDQQKEDTSIPPGMEVRKVNNDVSILIPKGGKMYNRNATTYVAERPDEFTARKLIDVDNRITKLEEEDRALVDEIRYLKSRLVIQEKGADKDASKPVEE